MPERSWSDWGPLEARYRAAGPRRLLALDGGGIRGLLTLQVLDRIEEKAFVFVDGGTTAYNNPAFLMYRMATEPAYRLEWPNGERQLLVVSVGTGSGPVFGQTHDDPEQNLAGAAAQTLSALMSQTAFDQDLSCRTIGRCVAGPALDREVGDLIPRDGDGRRRPFSEDLGRAFVYARYDALLTPAGLAALGCGDLDADAVGKLDSVDRMDDLERVGRAVADHLNVDDFGPLVDR